MSRSAEDGVVGCRRRWRRGSACNTDRVVPAEGRSGDGMHSKVGAVIPVATYGTPPRDVVTVACAQRGGGRSLSALVLRTVGDWQRRVWKGTRYMKHSAGGAEKGWACACRCKDVHVDVVRRSSRGSAHVAASSLVAPELKRRPRAAPHRRRARHGKARRRVTLAGWGEKHQGREQGGRAPPHSPPPPPPEPARTHARRHLRECGGGEGEEGRHRRLQHRMHR